MKNKLLKTLTPLVLVVLLIATLASVFVITAGAAETTKTYEKVTSAPADWSGEYLIVYEAGNVAFDGSLTTLDAVSNTVSVTITNNEIEYTDALANSKFTIAAVDGGYSIQSASGYYIGQTSNANGLKSSEDTAYPNTISLNNDGTVTIISGGAYLRYNATSGQTRFRYFKSSTYSSQKAITLYKLAENTSGGDTGGGTGGNECQHTTTTEVAEVPATCTTPGTTAGVICANESCKAVISGCEPIDALGHDEVSHDAQAATCTAVGWDAYVTCSRCDYTTYVEKPMSDHTYENGVCTVCGAKIPTYIKVDLENIKSTDTIIIVSTNSNASYALSNDKGTSGAPTAVEVTITDGTITTGAKNILWNISNNSGNLTIYPAGTTATWLYCTNTNNGVRVGTNENKTFTINSGYLQHSGTSRYIGVYNSQDWRCYTSTTGTSNIASQELSFYKLCDHPEKSLENKNQVDATCTENGYTAGVYCNDCKTYTEGHEVIPATGHQNTKEVAEEPATCTEKGYTAGVYCNDCKKFISGHDEIPAAGHKDEDGNNVCDVCKVSLCKVHAWKLTSSTATCTEAGTGTYTCSECRDTKTETVPATGHTEVIDEAKAPTCTETGLTEGKHCSVCNEVLVAQETVDVIDHINENGSCNMCGKVFPFKVGDIVIFTGSKADGTDTQELIGFADGENFGTAEAYSDVPAGTFLIKVVEGYESGTYAFKNGDKYITCNGEKNVNLSATLDAKSSWKLKFDGEVWEIISCSNSSYYLQYNSGAPRFTTYTGSLQPIKVVKVEPKITTVGASLNTGVKIRVTYNIPEAWLNAHTGAQVMFSCNGTTQFIKAVAGSYTYSVNLAPTFMSKTLNVQIVDGSGNALTDAEDVSLTTYKNKFTEDYNSGALKGCSKEKYDATIALIEAALKCSDVANNELEGSIEVESFDKSASVAVKGDDGYGVTVNGSLGANANLVITVTGATPASVTIGGKTVGTIEGNTITISGICHTMFNDEIVISDGTNAIFTFSFNTYLKAIYDSEKDVSFQKNFAAATYLYGVAAEAYNNAK